ncbi:MAG: cation diffusion facilitator family transporter [Thermanaerothrix sp.]|uniref:Cation diffusion facilitator family transporter n=1 Tax=Thermanaerothrix solaris TaxID=3058434 RepID=A0ABU3NMR0_9CHLR|nr:cation diffusion facilitator family transporter [Thermanaerothrix sp. 4228-RoL]MDT8898129.1 cation diffusion facilitator family transporter [Thermanaerothrix sp. 4228-RoL]
MTANTLTAETEKRAAALSSVVAAVGLTTFKIVVGISTGSLGILAEAAHSGLDLLAALMTFFAVRLSGKPADDQHLYGHGKIENLSALFETLLLLVTCVWIIYEAVQRLFFRHVEIEVTFWAFLVMAVSIAVDFTRSRVLYRAARKHNSQALEADALHFSTDIWSSSVVILGLIGVKVAELHPQWGILRQADAVAALVVALIVIYISLQLGGRAIQALLDAAPQGQVRAIQEAVERLPGVIDCHQVRVRYSGPQPFVDAHILVAPEMDFPEVHTLTEEVERIIQTLLPGADVTVHPEPASRVPPET